MTKKKASVFVDDRVSMLCAMVKVVRIVSWDTARGTQLVGLDSGAGHCNRMLYIHQRFD